ncbi:FimV/HubP family polar landmark protein [Thiothrix subterranea]|uniref:FimV/HubP family polar landmark protein n=1 Tax=Thiothrix subterranea TaxID=2735563 RepID=A0AA51MPK8_9GAMM|nr:FimV/HubP family polar landmark protein [Thiothrix subterranea]MDQ5768562.1 FimV/HubP family polar landmark protein [Thiothrix subterranea]WML87554.1 FimV/HubP family polar landmark protein [Thiothrix subterranea]
MKYKILAVATGLLLAASLTSLPPAFADANYGPVKNNDTLWDIASRQRPSYAISVPQMMAAIRAQNPDAFINGDINKLKKGIHLQIPVIPDVQQNANKQASQDSLHAEMTRLREQLSTEQQRSADLSKQLASLQANQAATTAEPTQDQAQVAQLQNALMIKLQTELTELKQQLQAKDARIAELETASAQVAALPTTNATPEQTQQADAAVQAELTELKQLLEQRDTHIQNLQASLREASISIKRQYAESQTLHARLKELEPGNTAAAPPPPAEPGSTPPPSLTLATDPATEQTPSAPPESTPVFIDQVTPPATTTVDSRDKPAVPLQNILEQQITGTEGGKFPTPTRVSLVVALISLMFILALLWRSISQRRALNREEARLRAELEA